MDDQPQSQEKREAPRAHLDIILYVKIVKPPEVQLRIGNLVKNGQAIDISEKGMSLLVDAPIPKGTQLEISFNLVTAEGGGLPLKAIGEVKYCYPREPKKIYRIGIEFTQIDQVLITDYVRSALGQSHGI